MQWGVRACCDYDGKPDRPRGWVGFSFVWGGCSAILLYHVIAGLKSGRYGLPGFMSRMVCTVGGLD